LNKKEEQAMNKNTKKIIATVCLSALGLLLPLQIVSAGLKIDHELKVEEVVINPPPRVNKHGKTYAEWAKLWWCIFWPNLNTHSDPI
jgi:hypothetical protein